jgi:uncharacterized ferritin-like protein (DUF455 family)
MQGSSDTPASSGTVRAFCLDVLRAGDLETKLKVPRGPDGAVLIDSPPGPVVEIDRPQRGPGLSMGPGASPLPTPAELVDLTARQQCLSRFAHHELQAVEYFAWALLRWPDAPSALRRSLLAALADEQRHCRLYLDRLHVLGGRFDTDDHSDYFWRHAPATAASDAGIAAFLAGMGLTLEQANLDFTLTYRDAFSAAGDPESAALCQRVHDDEIRHVALAARWLKRLEIPGLGYETELGRYLAAVPFPLGPARAKGRRFEVEPRRQAGLSEALIESVRTARSHERRTTPVELIPNLGAEEGDGERAYREQPAVRTAAHLWSLLFSRHAALSIAPRPRSQSSLWPDSLGAPPSEPAFDFLSAHDRSHVWLATAEAARTASHPLAGAEPARVALLHDKAFAARQAEALGLVPRALAPWIEVIEPDAFREPERLLTRLQAYLQQWPDWTQRRFTLKPRHGSSGRGRVGGSDELDTPRLRGAFPRLAARGGAIFEPWLDRTADFSVTLYVPPSQDSEIALRVLGSLELWTSASGVYRGHTGEVDSRGRVFSGAPEDEMLRGDAAALASVARGQGFHGACGVDAFRYTEPASGDEREPVARLRSAVEFNARPTMGLVAIGLVKRALPRLRKRISLQPGERCGFALSYRAADDRDWRRRIYEHVDNDAVILDLARASHADDPRASLVFTRETARLRDSRTAAFGC